MVSSRLRQKKRDVENLLKRDMACVYLIEVRRI